MDASTSYPEGAARPSCRQATGGLLMRCCRPRDAHDLLLRGAHIGEGDTRSLRKRPHGGGEEEKNATRFFAFGSQTRGANKGLSGGGIPINHVSTCPGFGSNNPLYRAIWL